MKRRPYSEGDELLIANAIRHLKAAAMALRAARCPLTLKKVRSAIKSADGAANNAHARQFRDARQHCADCGRVVYKPADDRDLLWTLWDIPSKARVT
jgi:hypothetical protein